MFLNMNKYFGVNSKIIILLVYISTSFIFSLDYSKVKIVDGIDKWSGKDGVTTPNYEYHIPDLLYGPENLFFLNGRCFQRSFNNFEYSVCPFQNVTQKRHIGQSSHLLGIWGNKISSNDQYLYIFII